MSIAWSTRVWNETQHSGTDMLMLLAIADYADANGEAFPAVKTLAKRCRMQVRNAQVILANLRASGELEVRVCAGPKGANVYRLVLGSKRVQADAPLQSPAPVQPDAPLQSVAPVHSSTQGGAKDCAVPLQPNAYEPSLNQQEPSVESTASTRGLPPCPTDAILTLFAAKVDSLPHPRAELWVRKRAAPMHERWKWVLKAKRDNGERYATTAAEALTFFGRFFDCVAESDFLSGRNGRWKKCTLDWLMAEKNFAKVVEGNYANDGAPT